VVEVISGGNLIGILQKLIKKFFPRGNIREGQEALRHSKIASEWSRMSEEQRNAIWGQHQSKLDCQYNFLAQKRKNIAPDDPYEKFHPVGPNTKPEFDPSKPFTVTPPEGFVDPNAKSDKLAPVEGVKKIIKSLQETWNSICWYSCK
jgi:hypothetical protein